MLMAYISMGIYEQKIFNRLQFLCSVCVTWTEKYSSKAFYYSAKIVFDMKST
jgi:hypothetical protein